MNLSRLAQRLRLPLGFILGGLYIVFARPTSNALIAGAAVAFVGLLIRAWASGHIIKNNRLATTGPYAHTRNPLYFGSFVLALGFAIAAAHWAWLVGVAVFWIVIYGPTIARERVRILETFPEAYPDFEKNVPAFFPRLTPWRGPSGGETAPFSGALYMRHGEWKAALGYLGAMVLLVMRLRGVV